MTSAMPLIGRLHFPAAEEELSNCAFQFSLQLHKTVLLYFSIRYFKNNAYTFSSRGRCFCHISTREPLGCCYSYHPESRQWGSISAESPVRLAIPIKLYQIFSVSLLSSRMIATNTLSLPTIAVITIMAENIEAVKTTMFLANSL